MKTYKELRNVEVIQRRKEKYENTFLVFTFEDGTTFDVQIKPMFDLSSKQYALYQNLLREWVRKNG